MPYGFNPDKSKYDLGNLIPVVLYDNANGNTGSITLAQSAANFDYMRIYFKKTTGKNQCSSVDVRNPNGKYVDLTIFEPQSDAGVLWFVSRLVRINGQTVTTFDSVGGQISAAPSCGASSECAIYRIEAW